MFGGLLNKNLNYRITMHLCTNKHKDRQTHIQEQNPTSKRSIFHPAPKQINITFSPTKKKEATQNKLSTHPSVPLAAATKIMNN